MPELPAQTPKKEHVPSFDYGNIPTPEKRRGTFDRETWETAHHESSHWLVALKRNLPVVGISVIPQGDTLGTIMFEGKVTKRPKDLQVALATGLLDTPIGQISGGEKDREMINDFAKKGGTTLAIAMTEAKKDLESYSIEIRYKVAEIIASMKNISDPETLEKVYEIAAYECDNNIASPVVFAETTTQHPIDIRYHQRLRKGNVTLLDELTDHRMRLTYLSPQRDHTTETRCSACGVSNGHIVTCTHYTDEA